MDENATGIDLHTELDRMRPYLLRFARLQVKDDGLAEDAVQDALIAVLEKPENFSGRSSLRTYVVGILKYKIIDLLRSAKREVCIDLDEEQSESDAIDALFVADGHTRDMPQQWGDPERQLEQADFFRVLELCLERLPSKTARVFMLREWLEMETEEICATLAITPENVWTILFRARLRLRECLDLRWFDRSPETQG